MSSGFMANWRCAFTAQSPGPAGTSTRPQQQHPASTVKSRDTFLEASRLSILRSIPEEADLLSSHVLRTFTNSLGVPQRSQNLKIEEGNIDVKYEGFNKLSRVPKNKLTEYMPASEDSLRFNLLMENIYEIEDILDDSDLVKLKKEIMNQINRLGALNYFHACLSRTCMIPVSLNLAFSLTESKDWQVNKEMDDIPIDDRMTYIVVPSGRKRERKLRRQRSSEKSAKTPALSLPSKGIEKARKDSFSFAADLNGNYLMAKTRRLAVARNESRMSVGVKDVAKLEKCHLELEERTGSAVSFSRWAQTLGTDEKALKQRLHFGWCCKDKLLKSTRSLVIYIARSYRGMGIAFDDLIQAGNVGVLQGAERFDPSRGYKFSTYVQYWIRKSMSAVVARHSRGVYIPATMEKTIKQLQKARNALSSSEGKCPRDAEVAEFTGLSLEKVRLAGKCAKVIGSIDQKIGDRWTFKGSEITPDVSVRTPEESVMRQHMKKDINKFLGGLHPRERRVLLLRYGIEDGRRMSLEEIGGLLQVSKEWVRRIEMAALAKLRKGEIQGELKHYLQLQIT